MHICLWSIYGYFHDKMTVVQLGCNKGHTACKAEQIYYMALYQVCRSQL